MIRKAIRLITASPLFFYSGELDYIEEDGVAVTLHNYFTILDKNVDVYKLKCELKTMLIEDITE